LKRAMASAGPPGRSERTAPMLMSSATGAGVTEALRALLAVIDENRRVEQAPAKEAEWRP